MGRGGEGRGGEGRGGERDSKCLHDLVIATTVFCLHMQCLVHHLSASCCTVDAAVACSAAHE